jgi:hypothetical protein
MREDDYNDALKRVLTPFAVKFKEFTKASEESSSIDDVAWVQFAVAVWTRWR